MRVIITSELRYSVRTFVRAPALTLSLLLTIALGIGSNASVHSFVLGLTKPELPLRSLDRVVSIFAANAKDNAGADSYHEYLLLKRHSEIFEWFGAARVSPTPAVLNDQQTILPVAVIDSRIAQVLQLPGGNGAVISDRLWHEGFGSASTISGREIRIKDVPVRLSGVAPNWLEGLYRDHPVDVWLVSKELQPPIDSARDLWLLGRLRQNTSPAQAEQILRHSDPAFLQTRVLPYSGMTPEMADGTSRLGWILEFAGVAVFLTACLNLISLLVGRTFARAHETSLRLALGANRWQLAIALLWDSVVISVAGALCGALLAFWTARVIPAFLFERDAERLLFAPSLKSILAASLVGAAITLLCGLVSIVLKTDSRPAAVLRRESSGPSRSAMRLRLVLVVIQMSACCVLATLTAFSFDSLRSILESKTGGRLRNAMLITAQAAPYAETSYFKAIEQATRATGAMPLTWTARLPGGQPTWQSFRIEPPRLPSRDIVLDTSWVTAESVPRLAQIPLAGRLFGFRERGCRVAVVNESAAAQLFPNNTVGRVVRDPTGLAVEIIGIVEDKGGSLRQPTIYYDATNQSASPHTQDIASGFRAPVQSQLLSADLDVNVISPNYFQTMKSSLVAGEGFSNGPIPGMCRVAIVNEEAANLYFGGRTGVGAAVIDVRGVRTSIIGIVHSQSFGMFQRRPQPAIYFPIAQDCPLRMTLIAAPKNRKQSFDTDLRSTVESVPGRNPAFPVVIEQVSSHLARTALAPLRITTVVFGASAVIGILLSILGLFGVLSDVARHRRRELAIRTALGAQPWRIVFHLLRDGGRLACAGTLAGMLAALVLLRLLVRITPGSYSPSPLTWLVAPLVLAGIVSLAGLLPAYRAIGVSPHSVLHDS